MQVLSVCGFWFPFGMISQNKKQANLYQNCISNIITIYIVEIHGIKNHISYKIWKTQAFELQLRTCWLFKPPLVQRPSLDPSVCKLFTFSFYPSEPLGQFLQNLTQIILRWTEFNFFFSNEGSQPFTRGDNTEYPSTTFENHSGLLVQFLSNFLL